MQETDKIASVGSAFKTLYVAGIGAFVDEVQALQELISQLPASLHNLAIIIVQTADLVDNKTLNERLHRVSKLPVRIAQDKETIEGSIVYLVPKGHNVWLCDGVLRLSPVNDKKENTVLNTLFISLAEEKRHQAIGILLSGNGINVPEGIRRIKEAGGYVLMQKSEATSKDSEAAGNIDLVLGPSEIAAALADVCSGNYSLVNKKEQKQEVYIQKLLQKLKRTTGVDFANYKSAAINIKLEQRMQLLQCPSLNDYSRFINLKQDEISHLFHSLLVGLTSFFRDKEANEELNKCLQELIRHKQPGDDLCCWVAGCSTGEEAYSLAIALHQLLGNRLSGFNVKIYATDIDDMALQVASKGQYQKRQLEDVPEKVLEQYFKQVEDNYELIEPIRQMVSFSRHDISHSPPFQKLDLISCRNLIIYFRTKLQQKVIPSFAEAMLPGAYLLLGKAETIHGFENLFETVNMEHKVFRRKPVVYQSKQVEGVTDLQDQIEALEAELAEVKAQLNRSRSENQHKNSIEQKLSLVATHARNGVVMINAEGKVEWVNESFTRLTGYTLKEVASKKYGSYYNQDLTPQDAGNQLYYRLLQHEPFTDEIKVRHKDGYHLWLQADVNPVFDEEKQVTGYISVESEITEHKSSEIIGNHQRRAFEALVRTFPGSVIMILDRDFFVVFTEGKDVNIFGLTHSDITGKTLAEILDSAAAEMLQERLMSVFQGEAQAFETKYNSQYYSLNAIPLQEESTEVQHILLLCNNTTERVLAQQKLYQSELSLKEAQKLAKVGNWVFDVEHNEVICSEEIFNIFEVDSPDNYKVNFVGDTSMLHPEDKERYNHTIRKAIATAESFNVDFRIITARGSIKYVQMLSRPVLSYQGKVVKMRGTLMDVTEREIAAERIRESEEWFKTIFNTSRDGFVVEYNEQIYYVNQAYARMYGYDSTEELIGKHISIVQSDEYNEMMLSYGRRRLSGEDVPSVYEARGKCKDGSTIDIEVSASVFKIRNKEYIISIEREVSERKLNQARLQHRLDLEHLIARISTQFINMTLEYLDEGLNSALAEVGRFNGVDRAYLFQFSNNGTMVHNTHEWCAEDVHSEKDHLQNMPVSRFQWTSEKLKRYNIVHIADIEKLPEEAEAEKEEFRREGIKSLVLVPIAFSNELIGFIGFDSVRKIKVWEEEDVLLLRLLGEIFANALSKRKIDIELENQKEYLRLIINTDPNLIFVKDAKGRYQMANQATADLFGCTISELIGSEDGDFNNVNTQVNAYLSDDELVINSLQTVIREEAYTSKNTGKTFYFRTVKKPLVNPDGSVCVLGVSVNITESKQYEEMITSSLHEKDVLLKEIHHRVKNNMAVISGLLSLQSNYIDDPVAKDIFRESQNRIKSMALIHEKLYQSESLARIEFSSYIKDLTNSIMVFNRLNTTRIELKIFASEVMIDVNAAVPLGLIVNELLSNAYKHAFKGRSEGIIELHFNKEGGQYRLVVSDNGIGIPNHQRLENADSLGVTLIYALASQLGAKVELLQVEGSTFIVTFEEKDQKRAK
jgi:PAS domain S-box-containing protein